MRDDANEDVLRRSLGIFDDDVEVAIFVEHPGVEDLKLRIEFPAAAVFVKQLAVRKGAVRVLVQELHVGVRRRAVEVEVILLHIFTVIPFIASEPEDALLEDRVLLVPKGETKTDVLVAVADGCEAVFIPTVGA